MPRPKKTIDERTEQELRRALRRLLGFDHTDASRARDATIKRWVAARLLDERGLSTTDIARVLGLRSHTPVVECLGISQPVEHWAPVAFTLLADFRVTLERPEHWPRMAKHTEIQQAWIAMGGERLPGYQNPSRKGAA